MASQSDIDSPLCKLNTHIDPITNTCSSQFPAIHHFFLLLQLLELSWLPCHNKGIGLSFVHFGLTCPYDRDKIFWIILWVLLLCSVRPSTMTEEYRVPDGMVGLSEYMHRRFLNQTWCLCCYVSCVETKIEMSLLLSLKSSAEEVNRLTKYSRILAARSRLRMVSYVLTPDLPSQQSMIDFSAALDAYFHVHSQTVPAFQKEVFLWQAHQMPYSKLVFTFKTMYFLISNATTPLNSQRQVYFWGVFVHGSSSSSAQRWQNNTIKLLQRIRLHLMF